MLDPEIVSELLEAVADADMARKRGREVQSLRGVRGVPFGEVARIATATWLEHTPGWEDEEDLSFLFGTAWEDGLVAVALLAAITPDDGMSALDVGRDWLQRTDDHVTADALGWFVLGPAVLSCGQKVHESLADIYHQGRPAHRRAVVMAGLALLPEELEGPCAAGLRARVGTSAVRFVDEPRSDEVASLASLVLRDEDPSVRKAIRRLLATWAACDPDAAASWIGNVKGGVPKMLREATEKAARKARRLAARDAE